MEVEESQPAPAKANNAIAPMAEPELLPLNDPDEGIGADLPSTSSQQHSAAVIVPGGSGQQPQKLVKIDGMVRLRRKRRNDPFGNLILSTKKMKLNDGGAPQQEGESNENQSSGSKQNGSIECGEDDDVVFYYGGEDEEDSDLDAYDDDEDSNAEHYYKNDYPDEEVANEFENESTSEDDYFDHYGDEQVKYRNYCYDNDRDEADDFD